MPFLRTRDYPTYIQLTQLSQICQNSLSTRINAENDAIEEASEYLQQKYDVENIFTDTATYNPQSEYFAFNLVELTGPAWNAISYTQWNVISYTDNKVYYANAATAPTDVPGTSGKWTLLGWNYSLYYLQYPYPLFDINKYYKAGDKVFWKGNVYSCLLPSAGLSQESRIQFDYTTQYPPPNVLPDDPTNGIYQWGVGVPYSIQGLIIGGANPSVYNPGADYITGEYALVNTQVWQTLIPNGPSTTIVTPGADIITWQPITWVKGDNRNKKLVQNLIHITLFDLHNNIAPENIPMLREKNYLRALKWLEDVKEGNLVVDMLKMPLIQTPKGNVGGRILIGSKPKQENSW